MKLRIPLLAGLALTGALAFGQGTPEQQVDALFAAYRSTPGAAVAVVKAGKVVLLKGYGLADVKSGRAIGPDTVFDLASVSKSFTAAAILDLAERGRLGLDNPIAKHCPELAKVAKGATIRNLLQHTSGLPDYMDLLAKRGTIREVRPRSGLTKPDATEPTAKQTLQALGKHVKSEFHPGTRFAYSNSGYVVLAQIAERASGMRFAELMQKRFFGPLGMRNTRVLDERRQTAPNRALSYGSSQSRTDIDYTPLNRIYGDGNVNTSARDMSLWAIAIQEKRILKPASWEAAWTPPKLPVEPELPYGFGWIVQGNKGSRVVSHGGGWVGFRTFIRHDEAAKLTVIVLSNCGDLDVADRGNRIAAIYAR